MPGPSILIAPAELLPALSARIGVDASDLQSFPDVDALRALAAITRTRPALVVLERRFSSSSRGAALVARIKADPTLTDTEVRIMPPEGESLGPVVSPSIAAPAATREARPTAGRQAAAAPLAFQELDYSGTRRAVRHRVDGPIELLVDGGRAALVDLSTFGAQIMSESVLKPSQRVRVSLGDTQATLRFAATVMWASFEIPKGSGARYRAGLEFVDADPAAVDAFVHRHQHD